MKPPGTKIYYVCANTECNHAIGTVQRDEGTSPSEIHCDKCHGMMRTQLRTLSKGSPLITREWYKPTDSELSSLIADTLRRQFSGENRSSRRSRSVKKEMLSTAKAMAEYVGATGLLERPIRRDPIKEKE